MLNHQQKVQFRSPQLNVGQLRKAIEALGSELKWPHLGFAFTLRSKARSGVTSDTVLTAEQIDSIASFTGIELHTEICGGGHSLLSSFDGASGSGLELHVRSDAESQVAKAVEFFSAHLSLVRFQGDDATTGHTRRTAGAARPKYQVFISSTFGDLHDEREAVSWAVLKERHIPAGMENFPATDDRGWQIIQRTIDTSDYYVVIVGGRYGSVDPETGLSWTEREYDYAGSNGVPRLAFIRADSSTTADKVQFDPAIQERLRLFKEKLRSSHLCKEWHEKVGLAAEVTAALRHQIDLDEEAGNARPGWYRGNKIPAMAQPTDTKSPVAVLALQERGNEDLADRTQMLVETIREKEPVPFIRYLSIENTGSVAAKNVRASFRFKGARFSRAFVHNPANEGMADPYDRNTHVHLEGVFPREGLMFEAVQRVKSIGVGSSENLIAFVVHVDPEALEKDAGHRVLMEYTLTSDDGPPISGRQVITYKQLFNIKKMVNDMAKE